MSRIFVRIVAVLLIFVVFVSGQNSEVKRYAVITQRGGVIVRANIEPGANMVMMAREGQKFEIVGEPGKLWLKVKTPNGEGYIPINACQIKDGLNSSPVGAIVLLLILVGAAGGGAYLFYTKKGAVAKKEDEPVI
jgi:hypothetical protein